MGHARTNHIQRNKDITYSPKSGKERLTKTDTLIQRGQNIMFKILNRYVYDAMPSKSNGSETRFTMALN